MNKQQYEQLVERLHDHHIKGEGNACTSHPIFSVQKRQVVWGLDSDYEYDVTSLYDYDNSESYGSLLEFFESQDEDFDEEHLPKLLDILCIDLDDEDDAEEYGNYDCCSSVWQKYEDEVGLETEDDVVKDLSRHGLELTKSYGKTYWEDVTYFLTREPAEEFRDTFGYRHGKMRVYVKSGWESDQYRDIISAMIEGKLVWKGEE
ncbi:hypothetical protein NVP1084O_096 [Vibrio phage 1.084.O._10N.261.49.F5]|nr:hypothetical protein NVP1084O_096 [Vibrio phage 1.084.O._10N.261.49.F5]